MAYLILKRKTGWSLLHREYDRHTVIKTRTIKVGTPEADSLGVFPNMPYEEAKAALLLNRADGKARYHQERRARIASRLEQTARATTAWLPEALLTEFEKTILPELKTREDRWLLAKGLIMKVNLPPYDWYWRAEAFWKIVREHGWGMSYVGKLRRVLNKWGEFYCKRTGKPWQPIPRPTGSVKAAIQLAHYAKRQSKPTHTYELTTEHLQKAVILPAAQLNSLKLAFWCGLRKEELDFVLKNPPSPETWYLDKDRRGFHVFHLIQMKLVRAGIEPRLCWKAVPLVEPEQEDLVPIIKSRTFEEISLSKLRKITGVTLSNRSARKGFSIEMEQRGYEREYVNDWLGHIGNTTAARSYRTRGLAMYAPPVVWESAKKKA